MHLLLSLLSALLPLTTAHAQTRLLQPFPDVPTTHRSYEAVMYLQANGIVSGFPDGTFGPEKTINRAEFLKVIVEAIAEHDVIVNCLKPEDELFSDVPNSEWYAHYVCVGKKYKMITGHPDGTFKGGNPLNFAETSVLVARNFKLTQGFPVDIPWFRPFVNALSQKGAIPDDVRGFDVEMTRGQVAEILYAVLVPHPPRTTLTFDQIKDRGENPESFSSSSMQFFPMPSSASSASAAPSSERSASSSSALSSSSAPSATSISSASSAVSSASSVPSSQSSSGLPGPPSGMTP